MEPEDEPEEKDAVRSALWRMFEDTLFPYGRVAKSVVSEAAREKAEQEYWNDFLPGHSGPSATVDAPIPARGHLTIRYDPQPGGPLAGGEIVRTWVPPEARMQGDYSSVLILTTGDGDRLYAMRLWRSAHYGEHRFFPIGAGAKDSHGRFAWVDIDRLLSVHTIGVTRTGFVMDRPHFILVADELFSRYGWPMSD